MKVVILGAAGRMGRMLTAMAEKAGHEVVAKVDIVDGFDKTWGAGAEGVIDFSFHTAVAENVKKAASLGIPYVLGTTGLTADEQATVDAATQSISVVQSGNYSLGINLMIELVKKVSQVLGEEYDIEVVEMHHRHKKDAPSGTALMLARSAAEGRGIDFNEKAIFGRHGEPGERPTNEIAIHALRGGSVVGDHTVMFAGDVERLELTHKAQSREAFCAGVLKALTWAVGRKPGHYNMRHVLGFDPA